MSAPRGYVEAAGGGDARPYLARFMRRTSEAVASAPASVTQSGRTDGSREVGPVTYLPVRPDDDTLWNEAVEHMVISLNRRPRPGAGVDVLGPIQAIHPADRLGVVDDFGPPRAQDHFVTITKVQDDVWSDGQVPTVSRVPAYDEPCRLTIPEEPDWHRMGLSIGGGRGQPDSTACPERKVDGLPRDVSCHVRSSVRYVAYAWDPRPALPGGFDAHTMIPLQWGVGRPLWWRTLVGGSFMS